MESGDIIYAKTNADFLNKAFGTNYKAWMKSVWTYDNKSIVWMVKFDNKVRGGFKNIIISDTSIAEENVDRKMIWDGNPIDSTLKYKKIVMEIDDSGFSRKYIFRGVYKYNEKDSDPLSIRYYDKIADEIFC